MAVPALDFDLVGDKRARVLHNKGVSFHHVILPTILHPQLPVANLVLKAWAIMFSRLQWLQQDNRLINWQSQWFPSVQVLFNKMFLLPPS